MAWLPCIHLKISSGYILWALCEQDPLHFQFRLYLWGFKVTDGEFISWFDSSRISESTVILRQFHVGWNYISLAGTAMIRVCSRNVDYHKILVLPHTVALKVPTGRRGQALTLIKTWGHLTLNNTVILVVETYIHSHVTHTLRSSSSPQLCRCVSRLCPFGWVSALFGENISL